MKRLLLTFLALVAMNAGAWAWTDYGFKILNVSITSDNYQSLSSGAAWSYDPAANVLHLKDGTIQSNAAENIVIYSDINPTLNVCVDGNCTLSGKFNVGIYIQGSGNHTFSGQGTLNIQSSVVSSTGISSSENSNANVTFKDLSVSIRQYSGIGFDTSHFASITFDHCDFDINTSDGMAMMTSITSGCTPDLILCLPNRGWKSDHSGCGYRGIAGEGLFASNVKINHLIKHVGVNVAEPVAGQKPATTATTITSGYKVSRINYMRKQYGETYPMEENEVFQLGASYKVGFYLEAQGDSLFPNNYEDIVAMTFTVNGNNADYTTVNSDHLVYMDYTFPVLTDTYEDTYDLWIAGIQVTKQNKNNLAELVAELSEEAMERYFEGDMEITYDDASQTLTLKNAIIYAATGYGIQSKLSSPKIKLIGDNTITADNGMGVRIQPGTGEPDKAVISGGGSLDIKASGVGLRSHLDLFLTDGVKITSEGDAIGFQGWKAVSSDDPLPTLTMTGPETMLRTKGTREGSFASYGQLNLQDDIRIMQPSGATFVPNIGIVNNNQLVTDEWVLIAKPARGDVNLDGTVDIADVTAVLTAMANGVNDPQYRVNDDDAVDIADVTAILTIMAEQ